MLGNREQEMGGLPQINTSAVFYYVSQHIMLSSNSHPMLPHQLLFHILSLVCVGYSLTTNMFTCLYRQSHT
uniref:Uncharacterized protein n=1 Tax=Rhizophora mucronata TaxID=61149 RepID=A0A2P2N3L4_RHIMU